jgi:leader peptidase (prepilin peptidase)/N-methyltransferase
MSVLELWPAFLIVSCGLLGLLVGSFLNVVAFRWPIMFKREWRESCEELAREDALTASLPAGTGNSPHSEDSFEDLEPPKNDRFDLWWPPSACPHCQQPIQAWQNIPVVSYLLLRGRCANCRAGISMRYPLVEAFTGLASVVVAAVFGPTVSTAAALLFTWFLIAMSLIDLDEQLLPDSMTLPLMWIGLLASLIPLDDGPLFASLESSVIGAAAGYMSLWSVNFLFSIVRNKQGMGAGDFKLLAAIGAWIGWQPLSFVIVLASAGGAIIGVAMILFRRHAPGKPIPFGPYLAVGGWIGLLWGDKLLAWYLSSMT